jgi:hypothetical protein
MKKAFDANVSKARPRLRLGGLLSDGVSVETDPGAQAAQSAVEAIAEQIAREEMTPGPAPVEDLGAVLRARATARFSRPTAAEALEQALVDQALVAPQPAAVVHEVVAHAAPPHVASPQPSVVHEVVAHAAPPHVALPQPSVRASVVHEVVNHASAPPSVIEVQTPAPPMPHAPEFDPAERRERLKDRLRAVRENPRPEPLPDTVAEAGVLAVERISALQSELTKARAMNLALTQDLEAARRQAERATEEARSRMDEARRLAGEMESRAALLNELEQELRSLEGERNDSLLALQDARQQGEAHARAGDELRLTLAKKDQEIDECLAEEERLAADLEAAQETVGSLRRASAVLSTERDTLARQVSELTRERAELLEARKALEAVHRALSTAVVRA